MDTRTPIEASAPEEILSVSFNDNASCFAVGRNTGYAVFDTGTCHRFAAKSLQCPIVSASMLARSKYLALVGSGVRSHFSQNKVVIWDDHLNKKATEISLLQPVRGVLFGNMMKKAFVVAILDDSVRLYSYDAKPEFVTHYGTTRNPLGLGCMSDRLLALPGNTAGHVQLVDRATKTVNIIPAHNSPLRAIHMSRDGELLATASEKGTLVRVWSTKTRARLAELRRGVDSSTIFHLAFNPSSTMLACTSDKSTLHIFDVPHGSHSQPPASTASEQDGGNPVSQEGGKAKWGFLGNIPFMPRVFTDTYSFTSAVFQSREDALAVQGKPQQGVIGWMDDTQLVVVGAGRDAKWEKFIIRNVPGAEDGKRECVRIGWQPCRMND